MQLLEACWRIGRALLGRRDQPKAAPPALKARDTQRQRVYRWEALHVFPLAAQRLTLQQCRDLVELAYRWHEAPGSAPGWAPPTVQDGRGRRHACGSRSVIKLPRWARTPPIVLHECAHGMADDRHGPRFVAAYVDLLERFAGLPRQHLLATLTAARIAVEREARVSRNKGLAPTVSPSAELRAHGRDRCPPCSSRSNPYCRHGFVPDALPMPR